MSIFNGTADDIFNKKTDYPIGSICMFNTNIDPNEMYGGTWVRIKGKFIFGADDDTYPLGSEGGEATHTLTVDEMPSHSHYQKRYWGESGGVEANKAYAHGAEFRKYKAHQYPNESTIDEATFDTGGGQSHNNMPPYVAFYIWAKVA